MSDGEIMVGFKMQNYTYFIMNESDSANLALKDDNLHPKTFVIINCVLNAPLMLISILGNVLVLAAIIRTPSIRSPSVFLLCSLAVSDLLVGFVAQPLFIADEIIKENFLLRHLSAMIGFAVCGISLATITAISVDRLVALQYPMRYPILVTKYRVFLSMVIIWLMIFVSSGFHLWMKVLYHLVAAIFTAICFIISTFCYIRIYLIVLQHHSHIQAQQQAVQRSSSGKKDMNMLKLKRSAMNTFIFYIFMVVCYFPLIILLTLYGISYTEWKTEMTISSTVVFMNSSINPFLYCWRLRELRMAVLKTAKKMLCTLTDHD